MSVRQMISGWPASHFAEICVIVFPITACGIFHWTDREMHTISGKNEVAMNHFVTLGFVVFGSRGHRVGV